MTPEAPGVIAGLKIGVFMFGLCFLMLPTAAFVLSWKERKYEIDAIIWAGIGFFLLAIGFLSSAALWSQIDKLPR